MLEFHECVPSVTVAGSLCISLSAKQAQSVQKDAQAAALGFYIQATGWQVSDDAVGTWLSLGMVAFLELAAAMSLTVAAAMRPTRPAASPAPAPIAPIQVATKAVEAATDKKWRGSDDEDSAPPPPAAKAARRPGRPATVLPAQAVERLRKAGGKASGTVRCVGRLLGTRSKTAAHRMLRQLAGAGLGG